MVLFFCLLWSRMVNCKNVIPCHLFLSAEQALGLSLIYKIAPSAAAWLKTGHLLCSSATLVHWHQPEPCSMLPWMLVKMQISGPGAQTRSPPAHILPKLANLWWLAQKSAISTWHRWFLLHVYLETQALEAQLHTVKSETMNIVWRDWKASGRPEFPDKPVSGH